MAKTKVEITVTVFKDGLPETAPRGQVSQCIEFFYGTVLTVNWNGYIKKLEDEARSRIKEIEPSGYLP